MIDAIEAEVDFMNKLQIYHPRTVRAATTQTLYWVNTNRQKAGRKSLPHLPRGERYTLRNNPVALAIGRCNIGACTISRDGDTAFWILPSPVIRFLQLFHDGYLPDFEL